MLVPGNLARFLGQGSCAPSRCPPALYNVLLLITNKLISYQLPAALFASTFHFFECFQIIDLCPYCALRT